jgi:hypothetical protein
MLDFQFYDRARLEELVAKENDLMLKRRELAKALGERKSKELAERRAWVRARVKELLGRVQGSGGVLQSATEEMAAHSATAAWQEAALGAWALRRRPARLA